jgi:hypothetical protein
MPKNTFSPVIGRYFDHWICQDTWDSYHPLDTARFYRFVKAVARYSRRAPSSAFLHADIINRWKGRRDHAQLEREADHFSEQYDTLLAYERTKGIPDALIEHSDIVKYHLRLSRQSAAACNRIMTQAWGQDWKKKLQRALME